MSYTASVITVSDLGSRGLRQDTSGPAVRAMLEDAGFTVVHTAIVPDEREQISALLRACADERKIDLILTTGGTGLGLSITHSTIMMHKGSIKVNSKEEEGTTILVRIPLKQPTTHG